MIDKEESSTITFTLEMLDSILDDFKARKFVEQLVFSLQKLLVYNQSQTFGYNLFN